MMAGECYSNHIYADSYIIPVQCVRNSCMQGKSSLIIFDRYANLKYKYGNRTFWCRGYDVDTVGKNIKKYCE